jgi:NADPH-dependent 2,4-dienoyl-CoA reductase/sulfur reductase-like enzyme
MAIVIIGNGVAGMEAALTVRAREPRVPITVVSEESDHFFARTALMWVHAGQLGHRQIEPFERDVYARHDLRRVRARALRVDLDGRQVELAGGLPPIPYDRLLIACGSRPRPAPVPGAALRGVGHFVTLQDLEWYEREIHGDLGASLPDRHDAHLACSAPDSPYFPRAPASRARGRTAQRPAIIGGGLTGIEAVEVAHAAGRTPRFFVRDEWLWPMALDRREARFITERLEAHGVEVHVEHVVEALEGDADGNVARVVTNAGTFEADAVVVAIGVVPNTDWLVDSGLALDGQGGVIVDAGLRTSAEGVFAAGDCASVPAADGTHVALPFWYTARDQGRVAGRALLGDEATYARGTWYNSSKLMDVEHTTAGVCDERGPDARCFFHEERGAVRSTTRIVLAGDRVVGFNLLGRRWDHGALVRWIDERRSLDYVLDHLHEAAFDTEFVPPLRIPEAARRAHPEPGAG